MPDSFFGGGGYNSGYGNARPSSTSSRPSVSSMVSNYSQYRSPPSSGSSGSRTGNSPSSLAANYGAYRNPSAGGFAGALSGLSRGNPAQGGYNGSSTNGGAAQAGGQPGGSSGLGNAQMAGVNAAAATAAALAVASAARQSQQPQGALQSRSPLQMQQNAQAVSRGPGMLNNGVPGVQNLNPRQVTNSLAGAFADRSGQVGPQYSRTANALQQSIPLAAKTLGGEVYGLPQNDYTAAANTMQNRMALRQNDIGSSALYGDGSLGSTLKGYDANGLRYAATGGASGVPANSAFNATQPGTTEYNKALLGLADANSLNWRSTAPQGVVNATHYYTGAQPRWARGQENIQYGAHKFSTPSNEFTRSQVAEARNAPVTPSSASSTMLASRVTPQGTLENYYKPTPTAGAPQSQGWGEWAANLASQGNEYLQSGLEQAKAGVAQINALPGTPEQQAALIKNGSGGGGPIGQLLAPFQYAGDTANDWLKNNVSAPQGVQTAAASLGQTIGGYLPKGDSQGLLGFAPSTGLQVYPGSNGTTLSGGGGGNSSGSKQPKKKKTEEEEKDPVKEPEVASQYYPQYYSTWANLPKGLIRV